MKQFPYSNAHVLVFKCILMKQSIPMKTKYERRSKLFSITMNSKYEQMSKSCLYNGLYKLFLEIESATTE